MRSISNLVLSGNLLAFEKNVKHLIYGCFVFLIIIFFVPQSIAQKKAYDGQGAVSEIIMASQAEMLGHFDMFFKSRVSLAIESNQMYWYKIVFAKPCTFDFTLFPLIETDRYSFIAFKVENNLNICDAIVKQTITSISDIRIAKKYTDNDQSEAFRSNLIFTKKVPVKAGEAVYLVIKNLWGKDLGHIIGLNTCDYSYVLQVEKDLVRTDTSKKQDIVYHELKEEEALASIGHKLCPPDGLPAKLGTISFNKKIEVVNQLYTKGESKDITQKKVVASDFTPPNTSVLKLVALLPDTVAKTVEIKTIKPVIPVNPDINVKKTQFQPVQNGIKIANQNNVKSIPVRCLVIDAIKKVEIDNLPVIIDELTGKNAVVKKIKAGEYEFLIEKGKNYKVECNAIGYRNFDHSINIYKILNGEENTLELKLQPLIAGENFILKNIYFYPNTPVIKKESNKELEKLFGFMLSNADAVISIEGHTNTNRYIGREARRQQLGGKWAFHGSAKKLSKFRTDEVSDYLIKKGISSDRIKTKGWGGDRELYPDARTLEESSKNMRVEVVILKT